MMPRKPVILALDVSKSKTGWAIWDTNRHHASIVTGSFQSHGDTLFAAVDSFHPQFTQLLAEKNPDWVVFEEGRSDVQTFEKEVDDLAGSYTKTVVNATSSLVLQRLLGDVQGVCRGFRKPHESVMPSTWRKAFLGYGKKNGFKSPDYKRAAKQQCEMEGIVNVRNADQAEAAGIAFWCGRVSQNFKEFSAEFEAEQEKAAAA